MARSNSGASIRALEDKPRNKCRKWKITVSLGRDAATGKYRQKSRNFAGTYTEAKEEGRRMKGQADAGQLVTKRNYTFAEYAVHWNDVREASGRYSLASIKRDRTLLKCVCHILGNARLQDITPDDIETTYARMRAGETVSGKPASGTYLVNIHKKLSVMFEYAKDKGVVASNPCRKAIAPVIDTPERRALSPEWLHEIVAKLDPADPKQFGVLMASQLGLRCGEVLALSREDFDLEEGVVHIRHSFNEVDKLKAPKNKTSRRDLPMSPFVKDAARKRIDAMAKHCDAFGWENLLLPKEPGKAREVAPNAPMVHDMKGNRVKPRSFDSWWAYHRKSFGAEGVKLHELRHTFITAGVTNGVNIGTLQKLSGHASPNVLLNVYTHINMEDKQAALAAMNLAS